MNTTLSAFTQRTACLLAMVALLALNPHDRLMAATAPATIVPPSTNTTTTTKIVVDDDEDKADANDKGHSFKMEINGDGDTKSPDRGVISEIIDDIIPLTAIIATFGMPVLIVFVVFYFKHRRRAENLAMAREFLNKGMPVPAELLDPLNEESRFTYPGVPTDRSRLDLRKGFKLAFIGLGVTIALYISSPHSNTWGWGLIPTVMGIGFIISGWIESRSTPPPSAPTTPPPSPSDKPLL